MIPPVFILAGEALPWIFIGLGCLFIWKANTMSDNAYARLWIAFLVAGFFIGIAIAVRSL